MLSGIEEESVILLNSDEVITVQNTNLESTLSIDTNTINLVNQQDPLSVIDNSQSISIQNNPIVITLSQQGVQGPPGPPGPSTGSVQAICGQDISAYKAVYTDPTTNTLFYGDNNNLGSVLSLLGIAIQAGHAGDTITVQTFGELIDPAWNWNMAIDPTLFLGVNGNFSQNLPFSEVAVRLGHASSPTSIFIRFGEPVISA